MEQAQRFRRMLWLCFFLSPFVLGLFCWILSREEIMPAGDAFTMADPLVLVFTLLAVGSFFAAFRIVQLKAPGLEKDAPEAYLAKFLVRLAVLESVGILGFVLAVIRNDPIYYVPFFLLCVLGLTLSYPKSDLL